MPNPSAQPDALKSLLADGAWLKRLAVGLVGESGAEDLAQDVMVSAMQTPPQGSGAQLRGWAKTVARRLAARRGDRGRNRQHAEQRAARPEASDEASEQRLQLHRRLTDAILELEPSHRTVLVMRFLDGLAPKDVAERLDIAPAAARKRISRALAKLRERLDGEFGDRATWMNAVGPLAFGVGWKDLLPVAAAVPTAAALPPILALWTMKKILVTSIALCLALWAGFEFLDGAQSNLENPDHTESQTGLVPLAQPEPEGSPVLVASETTDVRNQAAATAPVASQSDSARIHLVDRTGAVVAGGTGAWIDEELIVHPLTFDEAGRANLPPAALGALCLVRAEGLATEDFLVESVQEDRTVSLGPLTILRGQLLVDGAPPSQPVELECVSYFAPSSPMPGRGAGRMEQDQSKVLRELGLSSFAATTWTLAGGEFTLEGVGPTSRGWVRLPRHLKVLPDERRSRVDFESPQEVLLIETSELPHIRGRLIWDDDGSPFEGEPTVEFTNRRDEIRTTINLPLSATGAFVVPIDYLDGDASKGIERATACVKAVADDLSLLQSFPLVLEGDQNQWDMGDLRVLRAPLTRIRVVDSADRPLGRALVSGKGVSGYTDEQGVIQVSVTPGSTVYVLASGFEAAKQQVPEFDLPDELVIRMQAGVSVRIHSALPSEDTSTLDSCFVRLLVPTTVLGENRFHGLEGVHLLIRSIARRKGGSTLDGKYRFDVSDPAVPIDLPGLVPGTAIKAALCDAFGNTLVETQFVVQSEPGVMDVELRPASDSYGAIEFLALGETGQPLEQFLVEGVSNQWSPPRFSATKGLAHVSPLAHDSLSFRVRATGYVPQIVPVQVGVGKRVVRVDLLPGRTLNIQFLDQQGAPVQPGKVTLLDSVGTVLGDVSPSDDTSIQFKDVPVEALEVTTRVGTKVFRRALEAGVETVSVNLPTSGQLRVHFEAIPSIASSKGEMILKVQDPQDATQVPVEQIDAFQASETGGWDQVANLLPGTYTVRVLVNTDASAPAGSDATRTLFEGPVTITAGEETLIVVTGGANPTAAIRTR